MSLRTLSLAVLALLFVSCKPSLKNGDLLFQINDSGGFVDAIETSTRGNYSHVGILEIAEDGSFVLEADPEKGVVRTPLAEFKECPGVHVFRIRNRRIAREAVRNAKKYLGRPYDYGFLPGMETVYCSELVYESFRDPEGNPLFHQIPMSFHDADGKTLPFWKAYYDSLGIAIPEGQPGTNPNDLSKERILIPVSVGF